MLDKLYHIAATFLLSTVDPALAAAAGVFKELVDLIGAGTADILDLAADGFGILLWWLVGG
ncbi:MAG: hypothetical protein IT368_02965 [Candidatus Hydrogenedentes bacterium]|nr:hypothetical protein [Candidatus Hydrogenedentota bacterium]